MATWVRRTSFRVRLGVLVAGAVGIAVTLTAVASFVAVRHQFYSEVDSSLEAAVATGHLTTGDVRIRAQGLAKKYQGDVAQLVGSDGSIASVGPGNNAPLPVTNADVALATSQTVQFRFRTVTYDRERYRLLTVGSFQAPSGPPVAIQVAHPLAEIDHNLSVLRLILWIVILSGIGLAVGLGYLVGKATIRPVERLTEAAEHVADTQDLSAEIQDDGEDELARLARSFNRMLKALGASRQQQAQLISDAGHELRTPLTSLRTNIEVLLRTPDLPADDRAELQADIHAQLEEMTTLIGDVVELGREDESKSEPIEVRLDAIVNRAVERARRRAPGVIFELDQTAGSVRAQPALLERAILNVLDNAAKWSPRAGVVATTVRRADRWLIEVRDDGPGIEAKDLPHVFERFYRADAARSMPGSGLGLAIVHQVISTHGGTVAVASPPGGGTVVHIELPIVAETEAAANPTTATEGSSHPTSDDQTPAATF